MQPETYLASWVFCLAAEIAQKRRCTYSVHQHWHIVMQGHATFVIQWVLCTVLYIPGILAKLFGPWLSAVAATGPFLLASHNASDTTPAVIPQALSAEPALLLERYAEYVVHPSVVVTHNLLLAHHMRIVHTSICQLTLGRDWRPVNILLACC